MQLRIGSWRDVRLRWKLLGSFGVILAIVVLEGIVASQASRRNGESAASVEHTYQSWVRRARHGRRSWKCRRAGPTLDRVEPTRRNVGAGDSRARVRVETGGHERQRQLTRDKRIR